MADGFVSVTELAADYGCTPSAIRQRIARRTITAKKIGPIWAIPLDEAERVMAGRDGPRSRRRRT